MLKNLGVALLSLIASLGICETLARIFLEPPQIVTVEPASDFEVRRQYETGTPLKLELEDHDEQGKGYFYVMTPTGRRLRANTHVVIENHRHTKQRIEINTNSHGYRSHEIREKSGSRILFLGDSITLAAYLRDEDTFVRRIADLAIQDGYEWETINAGVAGTSLKNSFAILVETGISVEPDVVVLGFYLNDFLDSFAVYVEQPPPGLRWSWLCQHLFRYLSSRKAKTAKRDYSSFYPDNYLDIDIRERGKQIRAYRDAVKEDNAAMFLSERRRMRKWKVEFVEKLDQIPRSDSERRVFYENVLKGFGDWGASFSPHAWEFMRPIFEEFKGLSEKHDFKLLIVCYPSKFQVQPNELFDYPQQALREITEELEVPYLDMLPAFRAAERDGSEELFLDNAHHTAAGNRFIAQILYNFLKKEL